jgi:hypothetical protein
MHLISWTLQSGSEQKALCTCISKLLGGGDERDGQYVYYKDLQTIPIIPDLHS